MSLSARVLGLGVAFGVVSGACGSATPPAPIQNHLTTAPVRAPSAAVVLIGLSGGFAPLACVDEHGAAPDGDDACLALATALGSHGAHLRDGYGRVGAITGRGLDACGASGESPLVTAGIDQSKEPDGDAALAVIPAEAALDYRAAAGGFTERGSDAIAVDDATTRALAAIASGYSPDGKPPDPVAADEVHVSQLVDEDLDGDGVVDRLIAAWVPGTSDMDYRWSSLVFVPHRQLAQAIDLFPETLSVFHVRGTFDLEGDGVREVYYSSQYYEGGGVAVMRLERDGTVTGLGGWFCGA